MHAILGDPRAMAYWCTPPHAELDETREWIETMMATPAGEGDDFIVEHDGRTIGKAGFHRFPEIGFIFDPAVWGRGFAREALAPVIARAFAIHDLPSIKADVDPRNRASLRLLRHFGFVETSRKANTWLVGGQWCDSVYLELDRAGWDMRAEQVGA